MFYVKYKKNPKGKGEDDLIYEAPVPALTPPTDEVEEEAHIPEAPYEAATLPPLPPPSTTLRTIIHPDSEVFHGGNLKVTFGETEVKGGDAAYGESNSPTPSVALPHKEAQNRESAPTISTHGSIKRQGTYQTIPQEVYDQNPPKASSSSLTPTFQVPNGNFQQNTLRQQNVQHQQLQQQKVNFPRQASSPQQLPFRPQHTSAVFNNQQQSSQQFSQQQALQTSHQQQQFNQRPQFQQPAVNHQRQAQRQQTNQFSSLQSSGQNLQQRPQFRQPAQQFDQRPVQYSQPLNTPQQPQRIPTVNPQDAQRFHQQQQQQYQQPQPILRNQPINVPNQEFARYNQQQFPTSQPVNTPVPLPSKPIHPQFAHLYQQQVNLAQQNSQSFVPSTHQTHQVNLPQITQPLPTNQQQYRFSQPLVNIPQQSSTSQPLPSFHHSTPSSQVSSVKNQAIKTVFPNFEGAEVIKSISQSEEHLRPQFEQPSKIQQQPPQPTVEQLNQLNQLRNQQQINQLNQQLQSQQSINQQLNQQLYLQQQSLLQRQQQQIQNDFASNPSPKSNQQRTSQFSHPNQIVSTTSQPVKSTTAGYQTKYSQVYSQTPSSTPVPTAETPVSTTEDPQKAKEKENRFKENLAALPDEVPDDIREQLLSSGILGNADISILDYDKVGDIPIESLPPEALENFYGAGSAPVPAVALPDQPPSPVDNTPAESTGVEMKVVHYDPASQEGQKVEDTYIKDDATQVDSVILNDSKYNRYLPLKVSGSNFPLPDASILAGKKVNSVVVLAPVDYDFVKQAEEEDEREGRSGPVQVQGVRFIAGNILKNLIKDPTSENYKDWLSKEKSIPSDRQSVVLLVVS